MSLLLVAACLQFSPAVQAQNGLVREVYTNLPQGTLNALTNLAAFPDNPSSIEHIREFEAPSNVGSLYGQRIRGYVVPPQNGHYVLWIASDDDSILFLSNSEDPNATVAVARVENATSFREWDQDPAQQSAPILLEAGKRYYIEALMAEGGGSDHLSVRWRMPDGTIEEPIPEHRLLAELIGPQISRPPVPTRIIEGETAMFAVEVANIGRVSYQWERNGIAVHGATNAVYIRENVPLGENGDRYRVVLRNTFGSVTTPEAILRVDPDRTAPSLVAVVTSDARTLVTVTFSESMEPTSVANPQNYTIDPAIQILDATPGPDGKTVVLTTSPLVFGAEYRLTVRDLRDAAAQPNTIAPGTWRNFRYAFTPLPIERLQAGSEPLGPSTRRTGLVISEIMYHPAERSDGRNLQFIEIYNSQQVGESLAGYRLSGAADYTFPPGTYLPAEGFLVVAPAPADVQQVYGLPRVLGGFDALDNDSGTIRLHNALGAVLLEAAYDSTPPYSAAANGAGHSLILARPSYGERDATAWSASAFFGGSPNRAEPIRPASFRTVIINEFLAHTDEPQLDFVELYNYSTAPVDLSGCILTDNPANPKFRIPEGTVLPPLGLLAFDQTQLGFALSADGEHIFLIDVQQTHVIDAIRFDAQANGISSGRSPDGAVDFQSLDHPTPGAVNARPLRADIIINELMYHPISENDDDEYLELHNRSAAPVDVGGWQLADGVRYTIPPETVIPAGGFLVIARNAPRLISRYPHLNSANTVGNYSGRLSNSGERIALMRPEQTMTIGAGNAPVTNTIHILVNAVDYRDGGRWGRWSDGGGSSLELIDPASDNRLAPNWADSDETAKSSWTEIEQSGTLDHGSPSFPARALHLLMLGAGECLIASVEAVDASGRNLVPNSRFAQGVRHWVADGNHAESHIQTDESGQNTLRVVASLRGDTGPNKIRTRLTDQIATGSKATLRARARWLRGHPEVLVRLHGNHLEAVGALDVPADLGTPALPNSRRVANAGPAIDRVIHSPVLPSAQQQVQISARLTDPDRIARARLFYRIDPTTNFTAVPLTYNGAGHYSAAIPGQPSGTLAAFYIESTDSLGAVTRFPNSNRECLVMFGQQTPSGKFGVYRFWLSQKTIDEWSRRHPGTNARTLDATFVYGDHRVVYNALADYSGSPFHWRSYNSPLGNSCNYVLVFPKDDLVLGEEDFVLNLPSNLGSDSTAVREQVVFWMAQEMGHVHNYRRFHHLFVNENRRGAIFEDAQQPNRDFIQQWFPNDGDGDLYKIEDWFEYDDVSLNFRNVDATLENFTTDHGARKLARYRWNWRKRAVTGSANDFESLTALVDAMNTPGAAYTRAVESLVDIDQWTSVMALRHIVGDWDSYGYRRGKNMYAYKPENGKWHLMHWDIAFALGLGNGTTHDLFDSRAEPVIERMLNHPPFRRAYLRALQRAANGPLLASRVNPLIDALSSALIRNGVFVSSPESIKQWISARRTYVISQLATVETSFGVAGGLELSTNRNQITLTGTAPVEVKTIRVNGTVYPVTWTTVTTWNMRYVLPPATSRLRIEGYDSNGTLVPGASATLNATFAGATEQPEQRLVINEIHYNAAIPGAEFVEVHNTSPFHAFDLSNYRLRGVDFTFPDGTLIAPEGYVVVAADPEAFAAAYGRSIPIAGTFAGRLRPEGEVLRLIRPGAAPAQQIEVDIAIYGNRPPWPTDAIAAGGSLQLVDPAQDNLRAANWIALPGIATPGQVNSRRQSLAAFPAIWINEIQPRNTAGSADNAGERDPWVELHNAGSEPVDLTGYFLSDSYSNSTRWAFPAGAVVQPGEFKLVWVDGQSEQQTATDWHASFRVDPTSGSLLLVRYHGDQPAVVDFMDYDRIQPDRSIGLFPDATKTGVNSFFHATPEASNSLATPEVRVFVNEWMARNANAFPNPADGEFDDWFELFNAGSTPVDLSGYSLSDNPNSPDRFIIPQGTTIPPRDFLLVLADEKVENNGKSGYLHVNFKLSGSGEVIGLYAPDRSPVDVVTFGPQSSDISQGRSPDGNLEPFPFLMRSTPGGSNQPPNLRNLQILMDATGRVTLGWRSEPNRSYEIHYKENLHDDVWKVLREVTASGPDTLILDIPGPSLSRFYRIVEP